MLTKGDNSTQRILLIGGILSFIFLIWVLFRQCTPGPNTTQYQKTIDSLKSVVENQRLQKEIDIASKNKKVDSLNKLLIKGEIKIAQYDKDFNTVSSRVRQLVKRSDSLQRALNLNEYLNMCDSLLIEAQNLDSIARVYITMYNELYNQSQLSGEYKDSIIAVQKVMYQDLSSTYMTLSEHAVKINQDLKKSEKGRKFEKTLSRVLAGVALILGGAVILK